jgi:hypothetical protein
VSRPLTPLEISVLTLAERGIPKRRIARTLRISRGKVLRIIARPGQRALRQGKLYGRDELLRELFGRFEGNAVLVHRELTREYHLPISYPTVHRRLTEINILPSRQREITHRFETPPGQEAQADTSLYTVLLGSVPTRVELYRVILCWSRFEWGRFYLRFRRPDMKRGTYAAMVVFGGSTEIVVIDNTSLAVDEGSGADAVFNPEMVEEARALSFAWVAHEIGDADRSGKIERGFLHVEHSFLPGRTFRDLEDLNAQFAVWLAEANARVHGTTKERPIDRLMVERPHLLPLPKHTIDLSEVVARKVSVEGYISFETNKYSTPARLVDKVVSVHADDDRVRIFYGGELVASFERLPCGAGRRATDPTHHPRRPAPQRHERRSAYLVELHGRLPVCTELLAKILENHPNHFVLAQRTLEGLTERYRARSLERAAERALSYRAYDIRVLERILEAQWHRFGGDDEEGK